MDIAKTKRQTVKKHPKYNLKLTFIHSKYRKTRPRKNPKHLAYLWTGIGCTVFFLSSEITLVHVCTCE